ncbi:sensor histidine kinase [Frateuria terrea]|uniref:Two-component system, NarL family, sensor histidine kinase DesK n=1 Tax=Frateuria terrea TaxID=529704 RepID=A0A1H6QQP1_9GAMM|nr:sensor histidine kinase [Frateuria terrea]SEI46138.1 two-component system, NarL family, sensor histidine kinase DesK [Frateuria terrea]SFP11991.1 two-component system, NarL family, sensor histidine kinase DesK [Frateuria terrea]
MMRWFTPRPDSLLGQLRSPLYVRWQAGLSLYAIVGLFQGPLATGHFNWQWMGPTLLAVPVYLYLYARVYLGPLRQLEWHAAGIAVLGTALWCVNTAGFILPMMAGILLAYSPSWRHWLSGVAAITLLALAKVWLLGGELSLAAGVGLAGLFGGFSNVLYMHSARRDAELRLSQGEVRRLATLAERERIGRDLHDLLGHTLSLVALKSELAKRLALDEPARAQREMEEVERVARHALTEVRAAVTGMRRSDLAAELVSARLMLEASGVALEGAVPEGMALPEHIEAPLALVMREAITNIHRHARATRASVALSIGGKGIDMQIGDNGRGGLAAHGNGVSGMRERVRALGGTLSIDSPPRRGTVLSIHVPPPARASAVAPLPAVAAGPAHLPAAGSAA